MKRKMKEYIVTIISRKQKQEIQLKATNKKDVIEKAVELMQYNGNINNKEEYLKLGIQVNPLIIIQVPSKSDDLIKQIEKILEEKEYSYDRQNLAIWLSDRKENNEDIENNESNQAILIMKQAISTGWDCPIAKILVKLRDNMSEDFETQTIGRIRRMPQAHHYDNVLLDNCYLYTFDEK